MEIINNTKRLSKPKQAVISLYAKIHQCISIYLKEQNIIVILSPNCFLLNSNINI